MLANLMSDFFIRYCVVNRVGLPQEKETASSVNTYSILFSLLKLYFAQNNKEIKIVLKKYKFILLIVSHTQHSFTWHTCRLSGSLTSRVSKVTVHRFSSSGRSWDDPSTETSVFNAPSQSKIRRVQLSRNLYCTYLLLMRQFTSLKEIKSRNGKRSKRISTLLS